MTNPAVAMPLWRILDANGRPVHGGTLHVWEESHVGDEQFRAKTYLDPELMKRGMNPRHSNLEGWLCNNPSDGTPRCIHLPPGRYTIETRGTNDEPLQQMPVVVAPEGNVIEVRGASLQTDPHATNLNLYGGDAAREEELEALRRQVAELSQKQTDMWAIVQAVNEYIEEPREG